MYTPDYWERAQCNNVVFKKCRSNRKRPCPLFPNLAPFPVRWFWVQIFSLVNYLLEFNRFRAFTFLHFLGSLFFFASNGQANHSLFMYARVRSYRGVNINNRKILFVPLFSTIIFFFHYSWLLTIIRWLRALAHDRMVLIEVARESLMLTWNGRTEIIGPARVGKLARLLATIKRLVVSWTFLSFDLNWNRHGPKWRREVKIK